MHRIFAAEGQFLHPDPYGPGYDAAAICEKFGGGGHKGAGGAASTLSPAETGEKLAEAMLQQLNG